MPPTATTAPAKPTAAPARQAQPTSPPAASGGGGRFPPNGAACPDNAPIKGNRSSSGQWIYHMKGQQAYDRTIPEDCFATEAAAQAAGYRRALR